MSFAQFLNHGGHLWDTQFNVRTATGAVNENIDALEAASSVPEPLTILGTAVVLGAIPALKKEYAKRGKKKDKDA